MFNLLKILISLLIFPTTILASEAWIELSSSQLYIHDAPRTNDEFVLATKKLCLNNRNEDEKSVQKLFLSIKDKSSTSLDPIEEFTRCLGALSLGFINNEFAQYFHFNGINDHSVFEYLSTLLVNEYFDESALEEFKITYLEKLNKEKDSLFPVVYFKFATEKTYLGMSDSFGGTVFSVPDVVLVDQPTIRKNLVKKYIESSVKENIVNAIIANNIIQKTIPVTLEINVDDSGFVSGKEGFTFKTLQVKDSTGALLAEGFNPSSNLANSYEDMESYVIYRPRKGHQALHNTLSDHSLYYGFYNPIYGNNRSIQKAVNLGYQNSIVATMTKYIDEDGNPTVELSGRKCNLIKTSKEEVRTEIYNCMVYIK